MSTYSGDDVSHWQGSECAYPTGDGRPMGESDLHRAVMIALIEVLQAHYADQRTYVSGNILLFYRRGDRRRHVSPDVLVVRDHEPGHRENYLLWAEGRPPNIVIEVTSKTTRKEDVRKKFEIYRDEIGVAEYFLFDPRGDYLDPSLQGYRLREGRYEPIALVDGRLPSAELGLSFERDGVFLQVYDPVVGAWLPTAKERALRESQRRQEAEQQKQEAEQRQREAEQQKQEAEQRQREAEQRKQEAEQRQREAEQREHEAEQRRQEEAQRRKLAEEQQRFEEQRRLVAEEQLNRDRAEIERLRALLNQKDAQR